MIRMSDPHGWSRTEHDTMVIPTGAGASAPHGQPHPGQPYPGQPYPGPAQAGPWPYPGAPVDPAGSAAHWERRYRRQRTFLRVLAAFVLLGTLTVLGLGFAAWQALRDNPLLNAAQDLSSSLGGSAGERGPLDGLLPDGLVPADPAPADPAPEGSAPEGTIPEGTAPDGAEGTVPLPEELRELGSALGVTDVRQLLDLAVANGLMSQEQADAVAAAIALGSTFGGSAEPQ
jgi:hypothetical protein